MPVSALSKAKSSIPAAKQMRATEGDRRTATATANPPQKSAAPKASAELEFNMGFYRLPRSGLLISTLTVIRSLFHKANRSKQKA
jgi:hypothetical protein